MRAVSLAAVGALVLTIMTGPVGAHPGTIADVVDGQGEFSYGPSEAHVAAAGPWCFEVTSVTGHVGQVLVQIRNTVTDRLSFASDHPRVGSTFCTFKNQTPTDGAFSVKALAWGGQPGSAVTLSVQHP